MERYTLAEIITVDSSFDCLLVTLMVLAMATWVAEFYPAQIGSGPAYFPRSGGFYLWTAHGSPGSLDRLLHIGFVIFYLVIAFARMAGRLLHVLFRLVKNFMMLSGLILILFLFIAI